jgi:hypothetical protein
MKMLEELLARKQRIAALLEAIRALKPGDLHVVLDLDKIVPMEEDAPACLLTNGAKTGRDLDDILHDRLLMILALADASSKPSCWPTSGAR